MPGAPQSARVKFATQLDEALLDDLRHQAKMEGRQIQALVEEAINALIDERRNGRARPHVIEAYQQSHARFGTLYKKLVQ